MYPKEAFVVSAATALLQLIPDFHWLGLDMTPE
jgi:hypothetical protein